MNRGYSLIDLVLVLAITAVMSAMAVPRFGSSVANYRADAAAQRIIADLSYARHVALARRAPVEAEISMAGTVTLSGVASLNHDGQTYVTELAAAPYHARITTINLGGDHRIVFDGFGTPDSNGSLSISVGPMHRTITIDAGTGRAHVTMRSKQP